MIYSTHKFKMAESNNWSRENFARGWVTVLLGALDFFERRRREMETLGRASIAPPNHTRTPSRNENRYSRWDEGHFPHERAGALTIIECHPGGLSSMRRRGRGLSPYLDTTCGGRGRGLSPPAPTIPFQPARRGRGRGLSPPTPLHPQPLEDHSPPARCHEAPLRQPCTMALCLWPHGHFPSPPPYTFCDPNPPTL